MGRVEGKVALISGGGSGIGRASAELLAEEGAAVVVADIDEKRGNSVAEQIGSRGARARFVPLDVTEETAWDEAIAATMEAFEHLDVVVNNAGVASNHTPISELTLEEWRRVNSVNLDGVFLGTRAAIRAMAERGGSIVNISSIFGLVGGPFVAAYCASKGGVRLLTKAAAIECAQLKLGIRVNSIHPGYIDTPLIRHRLDDAPTRERLVEMHPIGHLGEPSDVASMVLYLASDESRFVTGAELVVDGGLTAR